MLCYKLLSIIIVHQDLTFGGIALKIQFEVFVYELNMILLLIAQVTYNQVQPMQINYLASWFMHTQITTRGLNCFKFIIALVMLSKNIV